MIRKILVPALVLCGILTGFWSVTLGQDQGKDLDYNRRGRSCQDPANGRYHPHGTFICQAGHLMRCYDGLWHNENKTCR
jgi:hypothetical protein